MGSCPSCGSPTSADARLCPSCGRDLTVASAGTGPGSTPPQPVEAKTSGMAVASLVLSLFSLLLIPGVLAIVFGHVSRGKIKRAAGKLKGGGVALVGLFFGSLGVAALVIGAIVIPNTFDSHQRSANQASAVGSLRTLNTAEVTYASTYNRGFASSLTALGPQLAGKPEDAERAGLIDEVLASGRKSRYVFTYRVTASDDRGFPSAYTINADPVDAGMRGEGHFFSDQSGVIRRERDRPANKDSPPLM